MGLGGTYSSALEDWLLTRNKPSANTVNNHFQLCDSVPDLSGFNENIIHSAPRKIPINNNSRYLNGTNRNYPLMQNHSFTNMHNSYGNGFCGTPLRLHNASFTNANINTNGNGNVNNNGNTNGNNNKSSSESNDNDDNEVQLRRNVLNRNLRIDNGNEKDEWLYVYRRPGGPNDIRHSCKYNNNRNHFSLTLPID